MLSILMMSAKLATLSLLKIKVNCSWFKINSLRLAVGSVLKFCASVAKGLKLILFELILTFVEVTSEKLVGVLLALHTESG